MTFPVKVVHLITLLELGGAQGNTLYTVQHLDKRKFETHLWAGQGAYWDDEAKEKLGKPGHLRFFKRLKRQIHPLYDLLIVFELARALKSLKPLILHTHSSKAGIVGRLAGRLAGVPIIIHTFHGFGFNNRQKLWARWFFVLLEKWMARFSTHLIFVSNANREEALRKRIGQPEQYVLIRSGVPLKMIAEESARVDKKSLKHDLHIRNESKIVMTIGAFKPQKNLDHFIQLAHRIRSVRQDVEFLLVGDGTERPLLEKRIRELNLNDAIHLLGWRRDIPSLLSISDVFVLTSLWEGLPRAMVEAMKVGIPCVCYETDGVTDLIEPNSEVLIRQGDIQSMAEIVLKLLENQAWANSLAQNYQKSIGEEFDINTMVQQQEVLYQRCASQVA